MRLWQQAVYLYGNNQAFKYVSKMATGPSLLIFRNRRASWNKYALNQFKTVNRESYVPELDARGLSKSALISRRKVSIRYGPQGYPVALGARIIRANGRQARSTGGPAAMGVFFR